MFKSLLRRHALIRAAFLAAIGPVLGFIGILIVVPILVIGFFLGWKLWAGIYLIGGVPSVVTTVVVISIDETISSRFLVRFTSLIAGGLTSLIWFLCYSAFFSQVDLPSALWVVALPGAFSGVLLATINARILEQEKAEVGS